MQERLFLLCGSVEIQRYSLKQSCLHLGEDMSWTKIYIQNCLCDRCWIRPNNCHMASVQTICAWWTGFWREAKLTFVESCLWGRHWARFPMQCISFALWGSPAVPSYRGGPERLSNLLKATQAGNDRGGVNPGLSCSGVWAHTTSGSLVCQFSKLHGEKPWKSLDV